MKKKLISWIEGSISWPLIVAWIAILAGLGIIIFYLIRLQVDGFIFSRSVVNQEGFGQFGDFIGGVVGSLWSLAAIFLIYRTYLLQKSELDALRKHNRDEQFQSKFFSLIDLNQRAVDAFYFREQHGADAFRKMKVILHRIAMSTMPLETKLRNTLLALNSENYEYFRFPYSLLIETIKLIEDHDRDQKRYLAILASVFNIDTNIYLYNLVLANYKKDEIPESFYQVIVPPFPFKLLEFSESKNGELKFSDSWKMVNE